MSYLRIGIVSLMVGLGSIGCSSGEAAPSSEPGGATELANTNGDPKGDPNKQSEPLDDLQIATVLHTVNKGEIQEARFAQQRASRPEVQQFAARMEMEHTQADQKLRAIFQDAEPRDDTAAQEANAPRDDFPRASSQVSRLLERQTVLDLQQLRPIVPPDFDLGYITKQVAAHAGALGIIHQMLKPAVQMPELRQYIDETDPVVMMHLRDATGITQGIIQTQSAK
jgi:putative membrane protein